MIENSNAPMVHEKKIKLNGSIIIIIEISVY